MLVDLITLGKNTIFRNIPNVRNARVRGKYGEAEYQKLVNKFSKIPIDPIHTNIVVKDIVSNLFSGIPRWRSPFLQYNVGAAANVAASAMYALALDENIYNINDGLAGNALVAELAVTNILTKLADIKGTNPYGIFTFGGTATNMYAMKVGIRKASPTSAKDGTPQNTWILVTQDAHFSHAVAADWLGVGTGHIEIIDPKQNRESNLQDAERKVRKIIEEGGLFATIIVNGGTTYSHTVDNIQEFVELRNKLVTEYALDYTPHLHVDSVIGWAWLFFKDYDFESNPLELSKPCIENIKQQYDRIKYINLADSWGVDFHIGVGACPVDCSLVIFNDFTSIARLSKKDSPSTDPHQLAQEFSFSNPVDYTLETSRAGATSLAALTSLQTMGITGYQRSLANLVEMSLLMRKRFSNEQGVIISNEGSRGYVTMIRLIPPTLTPDKVEKFNEEVNSYNKSFYKWDLETRMSRNEGVEYSYSGSFIVGEDGTNIGAQKFYLVSPHVDKNIIIDTVSTVMAQKEVFDREIWNK